MRLYRLWGEGDDLFLIKNGVAIGVDSSCSGFVVNTKQSGRLVRQPKEELQKRIIKYKEQVKELQEKLITLRGCLSELLREEKQEK
jgi:hypothetical protein